MERREIKAETNRHLNLNTNLESISDFLTWVLVSMTIVSFIGRFLDYLPISKDLLDWKTMLSVFLLLGVFALLVGLFIYIREISARKAVEKIKQSHKRLFEEIDDELSSLIKSKQTK